ncbi:MAG: bifunctional hydroxymethylpyrimidine kinase/phosphomethylpyrimidine kinase [Campylobacterota bacterium]
MNTILSIAGSDSSGGAGVQADIKTGEYHNVFTTTVITAITAQNTKGVTEVMALDTSLIEKQFDVILDDFDIKAIKIGMLGNKNLIKMLKSKIENINIPIVLDPVAISRAGSKLLEDDCIDELKTLFSLSTIVTPNKYEAKEFFNVEFIEDILLCENYNTNILFKDIDENPDYAVDVLKTKDGKLEYFQQPRANENNTHGTGCSFSTAIASNLSNGSSLLESIELSKKYIYDAIYKAPNLGKGNGPIRHNLKND